MGNVLYNAVLVFTFDFTVSRMLLKCGQKYAGIQLGSHKKGGNSILSKSLYRIFQFSMTPWKVEKGKSADPRKNGMPEYEQLAQKVVNRRGRPTNFS